MISDDLRCTPRQQRCLDMLERANGRVVNRNAMREAMYPPPMDEPIDFENLLKVTVCQLRKIMGSGQDRPRIDTVWGKGYRLTRAS
jgi:DNA-binding response OmpR family regulator